LDRDDFTSAIWEEFKKFSIEESVGGEADWCAICRKLILNVHSWEMLIKDGKQINFHVECVNRFEREYLKEIKEKSN